MNLAPERESQATVRLDLRALVDGLAAAEVRYVITGSVAAVAWTELVLTPGDLDIGPDLGPDTLARLAALLASGSARPVHRPDWKRTLSPEECERWRPDPATPEQLDHQLHTPHGLLDVVPSIAGSFIELMPRARHAHAWGVEVALAHPADLLATMRPDREAKHRVRLAALEQSALDAASGARPRDLDRLRLEDP